MHPDDEPVSTSRTAADVDVLVQQTPGTCAADSLQLIGVRAINYDVQPNDVIYREDTAHPF